MGVMLICMLISTAVGTAAALVVLRIVQRLAGRTIGQWVAIVVGVLIGGASLLPIVIWMSASTTTTIIGMDSQEGARRLGYLGLPDRSTSDFCYRISLVGVAVLADFDMPEADFLAWMKSRNFNVVEFDHTTGGSSIHVPGQNMSADAEVWPVRQYESGATLTVKRGYCYFTAKPDNLDNTDTIIYDLDSGRVYVRLTLY